MVLWSSGPAEPVCGDRTGRAGRSKVHSPYRIQTVSREIVFSPPGQIPPSGSSARGGVVPARALFHLSKACGNANSRCGRFSVSAEVNFLFRKVEPIGHAAPVAGSPENCSKRFRYRTGWTDSTESDSLTAVGSAIAFSIFRSKSSYRSRQNMSGTRPEEIASSKM